MSRGGRSNDRARRAVVFLTHVECSIHMREASE
jgi:hypothetical protein